MWLLDNRTPFEAERCWVRDKTGAEVWIVVVKASFDFTATGQVTLADRQCPVVTVPEYTDMTNSELLYESDLTQTKVATDVILNGTAYAPEGHPTKQWRVNLQIGSVNKSLLITGDRFWRLGMLGPTLSEPKPMTEVPLTYKYAFGGNNVSSLDDQRDYYPFNPIGCGYAESNSAITDYPVPNIELISSPISDWQDNPLPAGFSAIPSHWQPRIGYAGSYDQKWESRRQPLLPDDFDPQFFQCTPPDQQVPGFLKGGETLAIRHLTRVEQIVFALPKASFHVATQFYDGHKEIHRVNLYTVIIEPDRHRLMMVWQSNLQCHHRVNLLEKTHIHLKKRILLNNETSYVSATGQSEP